MKRRNKRSSDRSSNERSPPQRPGTALQGVETNVEKSISFMRFFLTFFFVYNLFGLIQQKLFKNETSCVVRALNKLNDERRRYFFHPVIVFPDADFDKHGGDFTLLDFSEGIPDIIKDYQSDPGTTYKCSFVRKFMRQCHSAKSDANTFPFTVGKYDEQRKNVYETDLFHDFSNEIDGFSGERDLHVGIDLGGPVGTKVYAVADGVIHSVGYNAAPGDYGYVIVIEHSIPDAIFNDLSRCKDSEKKLYALYGHLGRKLVADFKVGRKIKAGDLIAFIGDFSENGGWPPHVHFQLSLEAPYTHDMPGVVAMKDRHRSLLKYPDPRLLLGPLY